MEPLQKLLTQLAEQQAGYSNLVAYYEGRGRLTYLAPEVRAALGNRLQVVSVNIPRLLIDSISERLRVTGFSDPSIWPEWVRNDMPALSQTAMREALLLGEAYLMVWVDPFGRPLVSVESATEMTAEIDPATRTIVRAVKTWTDETYSHAVLLEPDQIRRYRSTKGIAFGDPVEVLDNPLGMPPVVRLRNGDRLVTRGISEMLNVLPLTDALVKLTTDMLVASESSARPRRWATGLELAEDEAGLPMSPIAESDKLMVSEDPATHFGQLPGSDLSGYRNAIDTIMRQISAVSGLPEHALGIGSSNPTSADAIRASEAALTAKAEARQATFGRAWADVARLMRAVVTSEDPAQIEMRTLWADPSTRSQAAEADSITKLFSSGLLPASYALRKLGYSDSEVAEIETARRQDALNKAGTDLAAIMPTLHGTP